MTAARFKDLCMDATDALLLGAPARTACTSTCG
jgi:hypothetical protein